jgi:putative transposase
MLKVWVTHYNYNEACPHMALRPGVPDPLAGMVLPADERFRHHLGARAVVRARSVLGGLHHEYSLATALA